MSYHHHRSHELRLAIPLEAKALLSLYGSEAFTEARRRAVEASNDFLARDWSEVALVVRRRSDKSASLLDPVFH
jgi:hypothetical protein